jgi:hypothetical protein
MHTLTDMRTLKSLGDYASKADAELAHAALRDDGRVALANRSKVLYWPVTPRWGPTRAAKILPYVHVERFKHW